MNEHYTQNYGSCAVDLPYPEVTRGQDPYAVSLLVEDYSGRLSELTAILQYFYSSMQLRECWEAASAAFKKIAIVEMRHLDLLAKAISDKCGDPCYLMNSSGGCRQFWNASAVRYDRDFRNILREGIESEQRAISQYQRHIRCVRDESVKALLERILLDEALHVQIFTDLYAQCRDQLR